jgi:redox-sensitive bicupin YhaK (pirin superfamily)
MKTLQFTDPISVQKLHRGTGFEALGIRASGALIDPFLMVDHFWMSEPTFAPHPHAGF